MRTLFYLIFFVLSFQLMAEDITIIELHENDNIDQGLIEAAQENNNEDGTIEEDKSFSNEEIQIEGSLLNDEESVPEDINIEEISIKKNNEIYSLPTPWENSSKEDLFFLFDKINLSNSIVLNKLLIQFLESDSKPKNITKDDFNHLKIKNLIKLQQTEISFKLINLFENKKNIDFYNLFKLNYSFLKYDLIEACDFNNTIERKTTKIDPNFLLKVDIFCTYIKGEVEEANFLNSLLLDANDKDTYFQELYWKLQNSDKNEIDITSFNYLSDSMTLYSAMIRVGDIPLTEIFLDHDTSNLSLPIILSKSSNISLRLKAAHAAYKKQMFSSESLAALYQTVDFSYDELSNSNSSFDSLEMNMAYLFQKANIQLLPITRLESLIDFWIYAENNQLNLLAYDISRNLIDNIEPSAELYEYGLEIVKAHIYNKNFEQANKWLLFTENYISNQEGVDQRIKSVKLLYNLNNPLDESQFIDILIQSDLFNQEYKDGLRQDILLTILSVIDDEHEVKFFENKNFIDKRSMPSRYLLDKIYLSSKLNNIGELLLYINISIQNKSWIDIHPAHLKVILNAIKNTISNDIFNNLIVEILQESKII
ncbi:MAG: hypothetical protein CFH18_00926 [Alphaproteobacteria bacterium MarineAlpha5_Bin8]|nr:MAG: hypothetical protein CFH18_00926 [Alphaproteobacteria bacterium MarineAlpha5_Bin8]PPR45613.1 MAG: hypothetical protein CFH17_00487 [Alphaproteobacteria bacterium MarineAlpha5_Bin7]PPR53852.1 MAG: hypothetical protein CFH16_00777 [Alphaproteobacteria bacterium MarineAlpha5_Bin6]|tara:strand:+ start:20244 stop:22028 length:1785 start_codon:yes stop_codon:yes gene_type:complete